MFHEYAQNISTVFIANMELKKLDCTKCLKYQERNTNSLKIRKVNWTLYEKIILQNSPQSGSTETTKLNDYFE